MGEKLNLIFLCKETFTRILNKSEKKIKFFKEEKRKNQGLETAKVIYFGSKKITKILNKILYSLDNLYLLYFFNKFNTFFEKENILFLEEEDLNSLAIVSLYFILEAMTKNNLEITEIINDINIRKNKNFIERNIQLLYFL